MIRQAESDKFAIFLYDTGKDITLPKEKIQVRPGIVMVEMFPAPDKLGDFWLPSSALYTHENDDTGDMVAGFESSIGTVVASCTSELPVGTKVIVLDGDGLELSGFTSEGYTSTYPVRIYGKVVPDGSDETESLPYEESILAIYTGERIEATGKNILLRVIEEEDRTSGGIYIPENATTTQSVGIIESLGSYVDPDVSIGQKWVFHPLAAKHFQGDKTLRMVRESALLVQVC